MTFTKERLGVLFILVGPGGVGKNALLNPVLTSFDDLSRLPTATTRAIRPGEQQGREHHFVTLEKFQEMIAQNELLEYQEVHPERFYGVPRSVVDEAINTQHDLIADIDVYGARSIMQEYPENAITIFIAPPSVQELADRLKNRQASAKDTQDRLNRLPMEMLFAPRCRHVIVNDEIEQAVSELRAIIRHERGEAAHPEDTFPVNQVSFYVSVIPMYQNQVLAPEGDKFPVAVTGSNLEHSALNIIQTHFNINPDQNNLHYLMPDNAIPLTLEHTNQIYKLTYHYVYHLPEKIIAPEGWHWTTYTKVQA